MTIEGIAQRVRREMFGDRPAQPKCLECSCRLLAAYTQAGIDASVVAGAFRYDAPKGSRDYANHFWVAVGDQFIDISGDQFDSVLTKPFPKVFVGPKDTPNYIDWKLVTEKEIAAEVKIAIANGMMDEPLPIVDLWDYD